MRRPADIFNFIRTRLVYYSVVSVILMGSAVARADSAAAWKAYQEGKNPLLELSLLAVGIVVFFSLLVWLNNMFEKKKKARKKNKKS